MEVKIQCKGTLQRDVRIVAIAYDFEVRALSYWSEGCVFESQGNQAAKVWKLNSALNPDLLCSAVSCFG